MRLLITVILFLFLLTVAFIFGSQNDQVLVLNYLIAKTSMTVATLVSIFTAVGFILGLLFAVFWRLVRVFNAKRNAIKDVP